MHQQHRSVYLDAPQRPSRQAAATPPTDLRSRLAATAVVIGVVALTLAALVTGVRTLVRNQTLVVDAIATTLDDPLAREELEPEFADAIVNGLVGEELVAVAEAFEFDVAAEAQRLAPLMLDDEAVRAEVLELAAEIHTRTVIAADPTAVDLAPLTAAMVDVIDRESPALASIVPDEALAWTISGDSLADFGPRLDQAGSLRVVALFVGLLLPIGLALYPQRARMAAWLGRWVLGVGLICAIAAVALPYLGGELAGYRALEIAIRPISLKMLAPAALAGIVGIGLVSVASVLRRRETQRVADEGAAAALGGYEEPERWDRQSSPSLDLAGRGLVDVNHPLTNI